MVNVIDDTNFPSDTVDPAATLGVGLEVSGRPPQAGRPEIYGDSDLWAAATDFR